MVFSFIFNLVFFYMFMRIVASIVKWRSRNKFILTDRPQTDAKSTSEPFTVGFFHPFCNSGGGGERVLWSAVKALQDTYSNCIVVIYTGDSNVSDAEFIRNADERFTIKLSPTRTKFVQLRLRTLVLDSCYPVFTLLGQSIGSVVLGLEALLKFIPDVYFETTGYAFTYPLFKYVARTPVCCYTHYPTISTDMLARVTDQTTAFNNRAVISRNRLLTNGKRLYYRLFARVYSWCGRCATCVMTNSSWTHAHVESLWSIGSRTRIVYPPCDVRLFEPIFDSAQHDTNFFVCSVAQFRPEKNHKLQIRAFAKFLEKVKQQDAANVHKVRLILIGSCRNDEDMARVNELRDLAKTLQVDANVEINVNFKFDSLYAYLAKSAVGIHSMIDEHFGIGIVECMAAGTVMIAHNSAGPKMDIVVPFNGEPTGFLACSDDEYADCLLKVYAMSGDERNRMRRAAREHTKIFSQRQFEREFVRTFEEFCLSKVDSLSSHLSHKSE